MAKDEKASHQRRPLYITAVHGELGGREDVDEEIGKLARAVRREAAGWRSDMPDSEAAVDVTFHVPGALAGPDYDGVRTGRWSKANRVLVVQAAVPESILGDADAIASFLAQSVGAAVSLAAEHLAAQKIDLSLERAREIAERLIGSTA
jgi:hypothetical protein